MCRAFAIQRSAYDQWQSRQTGELSPQEQKDAVLTAQVKEVFVQSDHTYGAPRITATLRQQGIRAHHGRVEKVMRKANLYALKKRRKVVTTLPSRAAFAPQDRCKRDFYQPSTFLCGDIKHIPTKEGPLYLSTAIDLHSRRCVAFCLEDHMREELVTETLEKTAKRIGRKNTKGVFFHSDKGAQYRSAKTTATCSQYGLVQSSGRVGSCYDNAAAESFFATLEKELLQRVTFTTRSEAREHIFAFIEGWYNTKRLHSTLGYRSPKEFEQLSEQERIAILEKAKQRAQQRRDKRIEKIKKQNKTAKVADSK